MESYKQMWMSLRNGLSMRIREYEQADNIAGLDDYGLTELDTCEGIMQEIEGLERQLEENNQAKEKALEFAEKNGLDIDESYPRSDWWKFRDERDSLRKQRDELINDMAEIKRKAEAFDEIKELVNWFEENDRYEFEGQVGKIIKIINNLERGSDE
ncbi:hypothetical protein ACUXGI_000546 [Staphylococcus hominis]